MNFGLAAGLFAATSGSDVSITDWISVGLTAVLIIVTTFYVKHTSDMATEMKNQRLNDVENRRREKSDKAAYLCLDAVRYLADEMSRRGPTAVEPESLSITQRTLRGEGSLIEDDLIRHRVGACAEVVFVGAFSTEQMRREGLSAGLVALGVQVMLTATRSLLTAYLAEREITENMWARADTDGCGSQLPEIGEAGAWIRCVGKDS